MTGMILFLQGRLPNPRWRLLRLGAWRALDGSPKLPPHGKCLRPGAGASIVVAPQRWHSHCRSTRKLIRDFFHGSARPGLRLCHRNHELHCILAYSRVVYACSVSQQAKALDLSPLCRKSGAEADIAEGPLRSW